jgi:mRNA-degrading endonuclease toxin of MazEF toxin-antitoxin module
MFGLIDFYLARRSSNVNEIRRGDIYEDQPVYMPARHGIRLTNIDPNDEQDPDFELCGRTEDIFHHPPLKRYHLESNEAWIVHKAKWARPVVVLSHEPTVDPLPGHGPQPSETYLCAPIFGADQHAKELRQRIAAYEFPNLFYLPESGSPSFSEGFVRLDFIQSIRKLDLRNPRCSLTADAMTALDEWLLHYLTGSLPVGSLVGEYRREEMEKL